MSTPLENKNLFEGWKQTNLPWELIILISVITLSEALGQYLLRLYKSFPHLWWLPYITWFLYGLCTYLLLQTYTYTTMGKAEVYWDALSAIIVPLIGIYAFNNPINLINWIGIALVCIGTLFLTIQESKPIIQGGQAIDLIKQESKTLIQPTLNIFNLKSNAYN
jgi:multidrug transporter EmrE-like cation transporter